MSTKIPQFEWTLYYKIQSQELLCVWLVGKCVLDGDVCVPGLLWGDLVRRRQLYNISEHPLTFALWKILLRKCADIVVQVENVTDH